MRHAKEYRRGALGKSILFFGTLLCLLIVSLILPLRPTASQREKRSLARFPEFSAEALLSGSFFRDIDDWFADTFPGRDAWLDLDQRVQNLYGPRTVEIHGEVQQGDAIPDAPFTGP